MQSTGGSNFYSQQQSFQPTTTKNLQYMHSTTPPLQQMGSQMNQYVYPQQSTTQGYMQQSQGFQQQQHPGFSYGGSFLPQYPSTSTSLNTSMSTDYSDSNEKEFEKIIEYIANLKYPEKREEALQELSKKRESFPKLAVYLWHSVGTLAIL